MALWEKIVRVAVGAFFVGTGAFKFVAPVAPHLPPGPEGFAELLAAAGVPLPWLSAIVASSIEVVAGAIVAAAAFAPRIGRLSALASAALAFNMAVAIVLVGMRSVTGDFLLVRGLPTNNEPWRLPLELVMLVLALTLTVRALRR